MRLFWKNVTKEVLGEERFPGMVMSKTLRCYREDSQERKSELGRERATCG